MKTYKFSGKTIEQAVTIGLKEVDAKIEEIVLDVIQHPTFFKKAIVSITVDGRDDDTVPAELLSKLAHRADNKAAAPYAPNNSKANANTNTDKKYFSAKPNFNNEKQGANNNNANANYAKQSISNAKPSSSNSAKQNVNNVKPNANNDSISTKPQNNTADKKENNTPRVMSAKPVTTESKPVIAATKPAVTHNDFAERTAYIPTAEELEAAKARATEYLSNVLRLMDINSELNAKCGDAGVIIDIITDSKTLVGYRGETIDALENLVQAALGSDSKVKVGLDSGGFREKRITSLIELAGKLAEKAVRTGRKVELEPMNSANRRVIHAALSENNDVITRSAGQEPNRHLVIIPKRGGDNGQSKQFGNGGHRNRKRS